MAESYESIVDPKGAEIKRKEKIEIHRYWGSFFLKAGVMVGIFTLIFTGILDVSMVGFVILFLAFLYSIR